jgi:hypothetical protein
MHTITVSADTGIMYKAFMYLVHKLGRTPNNRDFLEYFNCDVGKQNFKNGEMANNRNLTFTTGADATMFLLKFG